VDTIEQYRNAYKLFYYLGTHIESEQVRKLWDARPIEIWKSAAKAWGRYDPTPYTLIGYLEDAENMSRESFSAHIDEKENKTPKWLRRLKTFARGLRNMGNDWKTEIEPDLRDEFDDWTKQGADLLERIAKR
jgi:hypothetical protein